VAAVGAKQAPRFKPGFLRVYLKGGTASKPKLKSTRFRHGRLLDRPFTIGGFRNKPFEKLVSQCPGTQVLIEWRIGRIRCGQPNVLVCDERHSCEYESPAALNVETVFADHAIAAVTIHDRHSVAELEDLDDRAPSRSSSDEESPAEVVAALNGKPIWGPGRAVDMHSQGVVSQFEVDTQRDGPTLPADGQAIPPVGVSVAIYVGLRRGLASN
jgi:hypothetical protein